MIVERECENIMNTNGLQNSVCITAPEGYRTSIAVVTDIAIERKKRTVISLLRNLLLIMNAVATATSITIAKFKTW